MHEYIGIAIRFGYNLNVFKYLTFYLSRIHLLFKLFAHTRRIGKKIRGFIVISCLKHETDHKHPLLVPRTFLNRYFLNDAILYRRIMRSSSVRANNVDCR